jgi:hypothetical protein
MLKDYDEWYEKEDIGSLKPFGMNMETEGPFLAAVRGYSTVPDSNVDLSDPRHSEAFKKLFPHLGGICFHKTDKEGNPITVSKKKSHDIDG